MIGSSGMIGLVVAATPRAYGLRRSGRSVPGGQCVGESHVGSVSDPGDVAVWANQHGGAAADHAEYGELPFPFAARVDQLDPVSPWSDVKVAGLTEVSSSDRASCNLRGSFKARPRGFEPVTFGSVEP